MLGAFPPRKKEAECGVVSLRWSNNCGITNKSYHIVRSSTTIVCSTAALELAVKEGVGHHHCSSRTTTYARGWHHRYVLDFAISQVPLSRNLCGSVLCPRYSLWCCTVYSEEAMPQSPGKENHWNRQGREEGRSLLSGGGGGGR